MPLPTRSAALMVVIRDLLSFLRIPVAKINSIMDGADKAVADLRKQLSGDATSAALAIALGRACAEAGIDLHTVVAVAEIANREAKAELDREASAA